MLTVEATGGGGIEALRLSDLKFDVLKSLALELLEQLESLDGAHTSGREGVFSSYEDGNFCFYEEVRLFETALIRHALRQTGGNQARAARLLGLKAPTLYYMMKRHGIAPTPDASTDFDELPPPPGGDAQRRARCHESG